VRFFHTHIILNYHYFVAAENILDLGQDTDAALATYPGKVRLLVVRYPEAVRAAKALRSFLSAYMPDAAGPGRVQTENGVWTAVRQSGRIVAVVFDATSEAAADELLAGVFARTGKSF
jgi:hypothetical protein